MGPVLIFNHVECEGPGYSSDVLETRDIPYRIIGLDQGEQVPDNLDNISALVFMGGSLSVNESIPWIREELAVFSQLQGCYRM